MGATCSAHPLVLQVIYDLPGSRGAYLLHYAVAHEAGLAEGRAAALAPLLPGRWHHLVGWWPGPGGASVASGSAGEPWASAGLSGWVASLAGWGVGVLVGRESAPQLRVLLGQLGEALVEPGVLFLELGAVLAGHSLQITRYTVRPRYSLGQVTWAPLPVGVAFLRIMSSMSAVRTSFLVVSSSSSIMYKLVYTMLINLTTS